MLMIDQTHTYIHWWGWLRRNWKNDDDNHGHHDMNIQSRLNMYYLAMIGWKVRHTKAS